MHAANHLGSGTTKAQVLGESSSSLAGERAIPGVLLSKTRPQLQELCVLEKEAGAKSCGLAGGGAEIAAGAGFASLQAAASHAGESIRH
jgi:hypothetical protein